jgi:hypothetical protein
MIEDRPAGTGQKSRENSPSIESSTVIYIDIGDAQVFCPGGVVPECFTHFSASDEPPLGVWGSPSREACASPHAGAPGTRGGHLREAECVYPAIVQPKLPSVNWEYGHVFGCHEQPTDSGCGSIMSKYVCSVNKDHAAYYKLRRCNDPECPTCYPKFAKRISDAVTRRVSGLVTVYPEQSPYHLVFWPEKGKVYSSITEAHKDAAKMLKKMGSTSAVVWYHPYRIRANLKPALRKLMRKWKDEPELCRLSRKNGGFIKFEELYIDQGFWKLAHDDALGIGGLQNYVEYGPHFHAICTGYLMRSSQWAALTGCGYKKKGYLSNEEGVNRLSYYLTTHACYEWTKSTVRYLGLISYNKLASEMVEKEIEDVRCEDCGALVHEHDCDPVTRETGVLIRDRVTCVVKKWLYWKRGEKKPLRGQRCIEEFEDT